MELKKQNDKKILLIIAVIVCVCAVLLAIFFAGGDSRKLKEQLNLGNKYMQEMDYEQALAAYLAAIEIDPKNVEAYLGAASAYEGLGDFESALDILVRGYDETGDEVFLPEIEYYEQILESMNEEKAYEDLIAEYLENARELVAEGKLDDAMMLLEEVLAETGDERLIEEMDKLYEQYLDYREQQAQQEKDEREKLEAYLAPNQIIIGKDKQYVLTFDAEKVNVKYQSGSLSLESTADEWSSISAGMSSSWFTDFEDYYAQRSDANQYSETGEPAEEFEILKQPYELTVGNDITISRFDLKYYDEKFLEICYHEAFYIDLGDGLAIFNNSFMVGSFYDRTGITMDEFLAQVFVKLEPLEDVLAANGEGSTQAGTSQAYSEEEIINLLGTDILSGKMMIDGVVYQFPMMVSEFVENGWTLGADSEPEVTPGGLYYASLEKNDWKLIINVTSAGEENQPLAEGLVCRLTFNNDDNIPVVLPGNITYASTKEEADKYIPDTFGYNSGSHCYYNDATYYNDGPDPYLMNIVFTENEDGVAKIWYAHGR